MKGFKTIKIIDDFVPEELEAPSFSKKDRASSAPQCKQNGQIFFMESALNDLNNHIHWSKTLRENLMEQGGFMLGNVYKDPYTHVVFAIVWRLIPVHGAQGSAAYLDMGTDASYEASIKEQEVIQQSDQDLRRIGWYHTHPGGLGVFMSGTDMETQTKSYFRDWQFAVVLNPQRMIWRGFRGAKATEVDCVFVCDKTEPNLSVFLLSGKGGADLYYGDSTANDGLNCNPNKMFVRINGESIYLDDFATTVDTFAVQLYSAISIVGSVDDIDSLCFEVSLALQIDGDKLEFRTASCIKHFVNITDKTQVCASFERNSDSNETVRAIICYKDRFSQDMIAEMINRIEFQDDNEIFCIYDLSGEEVVNYFLCDCEKNSYEGKIIVKG